MPSNKNSLTVSSGRWAFADYMFYSGLVDLITFNGAYFNKRLLRLSVIVRDQVGTGEVELLGIVLQNVGQLRYQLSQFDSFPYLILGDSKRFCDQCSGRILLAILARSFIISIRAIPLPVFCIQQSLIRLTALVGPLVRICGQTVSPRLETRPISHPYRASAQATRSLLYG